MNGAVEDSGAPERTALSVAKAPERVKSRAWRSWLTVIIVFVSVSALMASAASDWGYRPSRGGAAYLPGDGFREIQGPSSDRPVGEGHVRESAIIPAPEVRRAVPTAVRDLAVSSRVDLEVVPWRLWWRLTTTAIVDATSESELFSYSPVAGLVQVLAWDEASAEIFLPALPVLPASGDRGSVWTLEGTVTTLSDRSVPYRLKGSLQPPTDPAYATRGCAVSRIELARGDRPTEIEDLVFCPGAGLVDRSSGESVRVTSSHPTLPAPSTERPPAPVWTPKTWMLRRQTVDSVRWPDAPSLQPIGFKTPAVTSSGTLVVLRGDGFDVSGLRPSSDRYELAWTVRPGGRVLSVTAVGDLVVAITGNRRLVAYDDRGRFVWEQRLPDVSHTAAQSLGRGRLLVVTKTGHVEVRRTTDGTLAWAADVAGAPTGEPAVDEASGRFYVGDDSGVVSAFGLEGPDPLWTAAVGGRRITMAATPIGVVVSGGGEVVLFEDGVRRWSSAAPGGGAVDVFADVVAVGDGPAVARVRAFDLADGRQRWTYPRVISRATTSDTMVMAVDGALIAVDGQGVPQARAELPTNTGATLHPMRMGSSGGVWLWWADAVELVFWGPES